MSPFIVLEGPDGAGTTLHTKLLCERLAAEGLRVLSTAQPSSGIIGTWTRTCLREGVDMSPDALQLLFCADRADHLSRIIHPALQKNTTVLCDRYSLSTEIYGEAEGVSRSWLSTINQHYLCPSITLLLLPPYDVCKERIARRAVNDHFEEDKLQRKVYDLYSTISDGVFRIDTSGEKESVAQNIYDTVLPFLQ